MSGRMIVIMWTLLNEIKKVGLHGRRNKKATGGSSGSYGKSPFSLDKTYHGCLQNSSMGGSRLAKDHLGVFISFGLHQGVASYVISLNNHRQLCF